MITIVTISINVIKTRIAQTVSHYEIDKVDEVLFWEKIKLDVRNLCIKYSKTKINEIRKKKKKRHC